MKLKDTILKIMAPKLGEYGFSLVESCSRYYRFENHTKRLGISVTVPPRCPFYLFGEYLERLDQEKASYVVIDYLAVSSRGNRISFSAHMFESMMNITGDFVYSSSDELVRKINYVIEESLSIVFPFMERFSERDTAYDIPMELVELLVNQSEDMAQTIVKKFGLSGNYREGYHDIEPLIFDLRGIDETKWKDNFYNNVENLVGIIAYLAQCISAYSISSEWCWEITPEIQTCEGTSESEKMLYFSAKFKNNRADDLNLVSIICDLWNYPPYLKCRHIQQIMDDIIKLNK